MDGLKVLVNTIVSPKEAFEALRERPQWVLGLLIAMVLGSIAVFMMGPAYSHAILANPAALFGAKAATMTPDQIQSMAQMSAGFTKFYFIGALIGVPLICLVGAVVNIIFNAIGRGDGSFGKYFAAQANIAIVPTIGTIVGTIIIMARGADSFSSMHDIATAIPSLAWLVPSATMTKLSAFLSVMTPFTIWAMVLNAYAMRIIGRVPQLQSWLAAIIMLVVPALLAAMGTP